MKWDRTAHPVSQTAVRVIFACFIGFCVLGVADAMRERPTRPAAFWVAAGVLGFLFGFALVAYFRPHGIPALITRSAFVGVIVVGELFFVGSHLVEGSELWAVVLAVVVLVVWLTFVARKAWRVTRA